MMKDCNHKINRGIDCGQGEFFSFCEVCGAKWYDNGKRWENAKKQGSESPYNEQTKGKQ